MAEWLSFRWWLFRYLVFPAPLLGGLFLGMVAVSLWVGVLGYAADSPAVVRGAWGFLLAIFTVNLLQMPLQLNQLLRSRVCALCPGAARRLVQMGMAILAVWALALALVIEWSASFPVWLRTAAVCWGLASLAMVLCVWQQVSFIAAIVGLVLLAFVWPDGVSMADPMPGAGAAISFLWPLTWLGVGVVLWWQLARLARRGRIGNLWSKWQPVDLGGGRSVRVGERPFGRFVRATTLSSHAFLRALSASALSLLAAMAFLLAERYWSDDTTVKELLGTGSLDSLVFILLIVTGSSALTSMQAVYRRLPALWLVLGGDRSRLYRHLVRTQWGLLLVSFVPMGLVGAWVAMQAGVPAWRIALAGVALPLAASLGLYWSNYVVGSDTTWMGIVGSLIMLPALALAAWAGLGMPLPAAAVVLAILGFLCATLRRHASWRWETLDLAELRSVKAW